MLLIPGNEFKAKQLKEKEAWANYDEQFENEIDTEEALILRGYEHLTP